MDARRARTTRHKRPATRLDLDGLLASVVSAPARPAPDLDAAWRQCADWWWQQSDAARRLDADADRRAATRARGLDALADADAVARAGRQLPAGTDLDAWTLLAAAVASADTGDDQQPAWRQRWTERRRLARAAARGAR